MGNIEKILIGAAGGLAAVAVKFLGQDFDFFVANLGDLAAAKRSSLVFGYVVLTPILMFLGALIAFVSDEQKRFKLLAVAVSAPAMVTTWAGGQKAVDPADFAVSNLFITSAYAQQTADPKTAYEVAKADKHDPDKDTMQSLKEGIRLFFGYEKNSEKYWVVVGSFQEKERAADYVKEINSEDSGLNAYVSIPVPPNKFYTVIVGDLSYFDVAWRLKSRALKATTIDEAYLSTGPKKQNGQ